MEESSNWKFKNSKTEIFYKAHLKFSKIIKNLTQFHISYKRLVLSQIESLSKQFSIELKTLQRMNLKIEDFGEDKKGNLHIYAIFYQ
jgi:hypothetical protein